MSGTVATTSTFALNAEQLVDSAFARIGGEKETGFAARSARRALQIMLQDWENRNIASWMVELITVALTSGTAAYTLPADTIDVLDVYVTTNPSPGSPQGNFDMGLSRISRTTYSTLPNKEIAGRPYQFWLDRQLAAPVMNLYPVPDAVTPYALNIYRWRAAKDVNGLGAGVDIPRRFIPAAVSGLAFYIAMERQEVSAQRLQWLEDRYERDLATAMLSDTDRSPITVTLDLSSYQR